MPVVNGIKVGQASRADVLEHALAQVEVTDSGCMEYMGGMSNG